MHARSGVDYGWVRVAGEPSLQSPTRDASTPEILRILRAIRDRRTEGGRRAMPMRSAVRSSGVASLTDRLGEMDTDRPTLASSGAMEIWSG